MDFVCCSREEVEVCVAEGGLCSSRRVAQKRAVNEVLKPSAPGPFSELLSRVGSAVLAFSTLAAKDHFGFFSGHVPHRGRGSMGVVSTAGSLALALALALNRTPPVVSS